MGIHSSTLSQYQSGRAFPSLVTLKKLCRVLDCSYEDILD
ncbi:MAG: helix-turn-helix domain-containing protein [Firmicutes bacterium]|nr:helix-turn-helix domain-containing protein [Bacillota bacterium]